MSYIDRLDLLLEAEGPSRRDFNKSVLGIVAGSNILPSTDLISGVVSAGSKVAGATMPQLAAVLNAAFSKTSPYYRLLDGIGPKKIKEVYDLLIQNKDLSVSQLAKSEPAAKLFKKTMGHSSGHVYFDSNIAKHLDDNTGYWGGRDIGQAWSFCVNNGLPKGLLGMFDNENLDVEIYSQIDNMLGAKPALMHEISKSFGGFDKYLKYIFDNYAESEVKCMDINNILVMAKNHQPALYDTLGLSVDPGQVWRWLKNSNGNSKFNAEHAAKAFSAQLDSIAELRAKGILNIKYDKSIAKITDVVSKYRRLSNYKASQEYDKENRKRVKNIDDDAIGRWEDEGGAVEPRDLDEAIGRLLNVIY